MSDDTGKKHKSLKDNVAEWLNKGGYPLEMRVAKMLRESGWVTSSSEHYEDPNQPGTFREIDVLAMRRTPGDFLEEHPYVGIVNLIIECKNNVDRPFVLFGEDIGKIAPGLVGMNQIANDGGDRLLKNLLPKIREGRFSLFNHPTMIYHAMVTSLRGENPNSPQGKDLAYEAVNQCLAGAYAWRAKQNGSFAKEMRVCSLFIPVIVVAGALFEAILSELGEIDLREIGGGVLQLRSQYSDKPVGRRSAQLT